MEVKIFYSWQSDLPNKTNRGFIQDALGKAVKEIKRDDALEIDPVVDRDTMGVPGSPDIAQTIFEKITNAQIFVCDVSIVNRFSDDRSDRGLTPNPNVLIELGYAIHALGPERIILVMNNAYGKIEELPFDLRMKRVLTYCINENDQDKGIERKRLVQNLQNAISMIDYSNNKGKVRNYLIGERLKHIRIEIGLSSSEFVEKIGLLSEKTYLRMEANQEECSEEVIDTIYENFGILPNYLKHGLLPKIEVESLEWYREPYETAMEIINLHPKNVYLTVNTSVRSSGIPIIRHLNDFIHKMTDDYLATGLIIQEDDNRYRFKNLNICMDFYDDSQLDNKYAESYYIFLYTIVDHIYIPHYIQIPSYKDAKKLFSGNIYPSEIIRKYSRHYGFLTELVLKERSFHKNIPWINKNRRVFEELGLMREV